MVDKNAPAIVTNRRTTDRDLCRWLFNLLKYIKLFGIQAKNSC
jgi:hypothetical protein